MKGIYCISHLSEQSGFQLINKKQSSLLFFQRLKYKMDRLNAIFLTI